MNSFEIPGLVVNGETLRRARTIVVDPDGGVHAERREIARDDRRGLPRRADDRRRALALAAETAQEQTARGWSMFASGFATAILALLVYLFLTT